MSAASVAGAVSRPQWRSWPRLPSGVADALIEALRAVPVEQARLAARPSHAAASVPTTYTAASVTDVEALQAALRRVVDEAGWPVPPPTESTDAVDRTLGRVLFDRLHVTLGDARDPRLWAFLSLVAVPDVALWRSRRATLDGGPDADQHVLGRLWWRQFVLGDALEPVEGSDPLTDVELSALFRRRDLVANPVVARAIARSTVVWGPAGIARTRQLQDAMRALLHAWPIIDLDSLHPDDLDALVARSFAGELPV